MPSKSLESGNNGQQTQEERLNHIRTILLELTEGNNLLVARLFNDLLAVGRISHRPIQFERSGGNYVIRFLKPSDLPTPATPAAKTTP